MRQTDAHVMLMLGETTFWIEVAMMIFFVVFLGIVFYVLLARPGAFKKAAQIPLDDQAVMTPRQETASTDGTAKASDEPQTD